jgi:plastocyanin
MKNRKLAVGIAAACVAVGTSGVAVAANTAPTPASVTIKQSQTFNAKPNRFIQNGLRWDKDVYKVKSGGTVTVVNTKADEGPHTLTVVRKKDLPLTVPAILQCKICSTLEKAHGADPNSNAPPKFQFLENGVGQDTEPNLDKPGDSGLTGTGQKGEKVSFKVTAKKGSDLYFLCILHSWMQAEIQVR